MSAQQQFIDQLRKDIAAHHSLLQLRTLLVRFNHQGMSLDCLSQLLQQLRYTEDEDLILELMDFIEGFCRPDLAIVSQKKRI